MWRPMAAYPTAKQNRMTPAMRKVAGVPTPVPNAYDSGTEPTMAPIGATAAMTMSMISGAVSPWVWKPYQWKW